MNYLEFLKERDLTHVLGCTENKSLSCYSCACCCTAEDNKPCEGWKPSRFGTPSRANNCEYGSCTSITCTYNKFLQEIKGA